MMNLLFDSGILGQLCHPFAPKNRATVAWLQQTLQYPRQVELIFPEICDYELRRKLMHLIGKGQASSDSLYRLDDLGSKLKYLPLDTDTMLRAAELWADAQSRGLPTAPDHSLDGDVILASQALEAKGTVVTNNSKHLSRFVAAKTWQEIRWP
jgi:predicted nucleic acid-binding protein